MTFRKRSACCGFAIICVAGAAAAQTPAPAAQAAPGGPAVASPSYTSIPLDITVNRPADDAAREADKARRIATFTRALQNMKTLAEGGTLPPAPARGRGAQH